MIVNHEDVGHLFLCVSEIFYFGGLAGSGIYLEEAPFPSLGLVGAVDHGLGVPVELACADIECGGGVFRALLVAQVAYLGGLAGRFVDFVERGCARKAPQLPLGIERDSRELVFQRGYIDQVAAVEWHVAQHVGGIGIVVVGARGIHLAADIVVGKCECTVDVVTVYLYVGIRLCPCVYVELTEGHLIVTREHSTALEVVVAVDVCAAMKLCPYFFWRYRLDGRRLVGGKCVEASLRRVGCAAVPRPAIRDGCVEPDFVGTLCRCNTGHGRHAYHRCSEQ